MPGPVQPVAGRRLGARGEERGAGEILLTSIDADGTREGYDLELTRAVAGAVSIPVIASGGAGQARHVAEALEVAQAALLASILHENPARLGTLRAELRATRRAAPRCSLSSELRAAIVQDAADGRVLMLAWMDEEALRLTRETGEAHFWSRSRQTLWRKGETSGNTLVGRRADATTATATRSCSGWSPPGPACHTRLAVVLRARGSGAGSQSGRRLGLRGRTSRGCSTAGPRRARRSSARRASRRPWRPSARATSV